jgi:hypothetical protein
MSQTRMPSSYYAVLITFAVFFTSLNIYILTLWLAHPLASPVWLIGVLGGAIGLFYSIGLVRTQQAELVEKKRQETSIESIED